MAKNNPERNRERASEWYEANKEQVKEKRAAYYQENKERAAERSREWHKANPDAKKWQAIRHRYGLTEEAWNELLEKQNGVCAVCLNESDKYHVDHDHSCCAERKTCGNCVRGLLCPNCNRALGMMKEDKRAIQRMLDYL